ncbi:hypothetical protein [Pacificimonas flava]|uniref:Uncharacterized protein n=1 Tax=Pacificimonas flava TaxID=1234595 RepID=M2U501_9SPHN|nr:hypothetical protein [Pacificimonas flava]EMD83068.1 hypothetical protein C725_1666 [Pacificimonas flava]MBB5280224.1 hypothetical protein [Pacificimonas flava]
MDDIGIIITVFGALAFVCKSLFDVIGLWQRERTLRAAIKAGGGTVETLLRRPDERSAASLALSGALLIALAVAALAALLWSGEETATDLMPLTLLTLLPGCVYLGAAWLRRRRERRRAGPERALPAE